MAPHFLSTHRFQRRHYQWRFTGTGGSDLYLCKTRCQREIEATDRQIDQLVYELYSLTEEEIKIVEEETEEDPLSRVRVFRGKGCQQCNGSGFRGRLGIFELFEIDDQTKQMIVERRGSSLIRAAAIEKGMKTMLQDGLAKAFLGETTLDEVLRVAI